MDQNQLIPAGASREREEFYGNFLLSWNFILLVVIDLFFIWQGLNFYHDPTSRSKALLDLIPIVLFSTIFAGQLFYFRITDDSLEIRNHIFRWYRRKYLLKDINCLVIEKAMNRFSRSLRVKSATSRPWSYFAGSLEDTDWYDFDKVLRKRGIPVDNKLWRF
jgi:hypothetical protein